MAEEAQTRQPRAMERMNFLVIFMEIPIEWRLHAALTSEKGENFLELFN
jgi:hypothetical protein